MQNASQKPPAHALPPGAT